MKFNKLLVLLLGTILMISFASAVWWNPFTWFDQTSDTVLKDMGVTGMKIVNFDINGEKTSDLSSDKANYLLETEFTKTDKTITQEIYYTNKKESVENLNFSTIVEIDYSQIRWNGTRYNLGEKPIKLTSWYDKYGYLIVPNIFMDDKFNKRINYRDVAEKGGYALAYSSWGKYYIELRIDNLNIKSDERYFIDPTYTNTTDGFYLTGTTQEPSGMTFNGTNYLVTDIANFVSCYSSTGTNLSCGFVAPCGDLQGIQYDVNNPSQFYISCNIGIVKVNSAGANVSGGFGATGTELAMNTTNIWISGDNTKPKCYDLSGNAIAACDIDFAFTGATRFFGVATNGSVFAGGALSKTVYFTDMKGNDLGYTLDMTLAGVSSAPRLDISPNGHYFYDSDYSDKFVYVFWDGITPPTSTISITSPANNSNFSYTNVPVSYTYFNTTTATCSYSINGGTTNTSITCGNNITSVNWAEGVTNIYLYLVDDSGSVSSAKTFRVDTTHPVVNITLPLNTTYITNFATNNSVAINLNWTSYDETTLQNCSYSYDGGVNNSVTCGQNQSVNLTFGGHRFNVYAYDEVGNLGQNSISGYWTYGVFQNGVTYNSSAYETSNEQFLLNISYSPLFTYNGATLYYNGIGYTTSYSNGIVYNTLSLPQTNTTITRGFNWTITLTNSSGNYNFTTENYNQTILPIYSIVVQDANCTGGYFSAKNFGLYDEQNLSAINGTLEYHFKYGLGIGNTTFKDIYGNVSSTNLYICVNSTLGSEVLGSGVISYYSTGYAVRKYYIFSGTILSNATVENLNLFDIISSVAYQFKIIYKDASFTPISNVYVRLFKQFISLSQNYNVEDTITDSYGQGTAHLLNGNQYSVGVYDTNGTLLSYYPVITALCNNALTGDCAINLNAISSIYNFEDWSTSGDLTYYTNYTDSLRQLTLTWNFINANIVKNVRMKVDLNNILYVNSTVCDQNSTANHDVFICNIPASLGNYTFDVKIYENGKVLTQGNVIVGDNRQQLFGNNGIILAVIFVMAMALMFVNSPTTTIVGAILGLIMVGLLGLVSLTSNTTISSVIFGGSAVVWLVVVGGVLIWKINSSSGGTA